MAKLKRFKKIVKYKWGDYWVLFFPVNLFFSLMSLLFLRINALGGIYYVPIMVSLTATIFIMPFVEVDRTVYYEEVK